MNAPFASRASVVMVLLATAGLPGAAAAQYRLPTIVSSVKADSLQEAAVELRTAGRWRDAARLYRRSAEFRAAEDPRGPSPSPRPRPSPTPPAIVREPGPTWPTRPSVRSRGETSGQRRWPIWTRRGSRRSRRSRARCGSSATGPRSWRPRPYSVSRTAA